MRDDAATRIKPGRTGDFVDLSGLQPHQVDRFLFLLRATGLAYRSGASGVEVALGHGDAITEALGDAMEFVVDDAETNRADELATLGKRALGFLFDAVVVAAVGAFAAVVVAAVIGTFVNRSEGEDPNLIEVSVVLAVPTIASFMLICVATFRRGRTVGKRGASTLVVDFGTAGEISFGQSFVRWLVPLAPALVAAVASSQISARPAIWSIAAVATVVIYATAWFDQYSRGLHDRLAGTLVVVDPTSQQGSDQLRLEERLHDGGYSRFGG